MAIGKNKRQSKGGRRGNKKKGIDAMARKEWYDVLAPTVFANRKFCKTLVTKTIGTKLASDGLRHRVFQTFLSDLQNQPEHGHIKMRLRCEDIVGRNCLTQFYGMDTTVDKLRSMVRKWISLIECVQDVSTTDGYRLRLFVLAFTRPQERQVRRNAYANTSHKKQIRAITSRIIREHVSKTDLASVVKKLHSKQIASEIEMKGSVVYPLQNVIIRKVKTLKTPMFNSQRLLDAHGNDIPVSVEEIGESVNVA